MAHTVEIIQPTGILNHSNAYKLRQKITEILEKKKANIILLDLQDINFIDSGGVGILVAIVKQVSSAGGEFYLCSLTDQVKMMFELTRMGRIFKIFPDRYEFAESVIKIK